MGSSFWKDCQPIGPANGGSDSGHDSKSEYKNVEGYEENSSNDRDDRLESEDEGQKGVGKGPRVYSDVPTDEMLSDEYCEQDGEDQIDSMHYREFSHSAGLSSGPQSKTVAVNNNVSRRSRALKNHGVDDDNDNENNDDADYEEEDEKEDDPDDLDFEPDYGVTGGRTGNLSQLVNES